MRGSSDQRTLRDAWVDDEPTEVNSGESETGTARQGSWLPRSLQDPGGNRLHRRAFAFGGFAASAAGVTTWVDSTPGLFPGQRIAAVLACVLFVAFAGAAVRQMTRQVSGPLLVRAGAAGAHRVRMVLTGVGYCFVLLAALVLLKVPVGQLLVSGALTGVVVGIAAQQSLGNAFAGIILIATAPFRVGDHLTLRSGALGGQYDGTITDVSLTFTTMATLEGPMKFPNSAVLGAATGLRPIPASEF